MRVIACAEIMEAAPVPRVFGEALTQRIMQMRNPGRRCASSSAWNLLEWLLDTQGIKDIPRVCFTEKGKPYFVNRQMYFSISHSKMMCAVSLADAETGVDVEFVRSSYSPALIRRTINESEMLTYDGDFTRLWCRKESVAKLSGQGLCAHPSEICTTGSEYVFVEESITDSARNQYRLAAAFLGSPDSAYFFDRTNNIGYEIEPESSY